MSSAIPKVRFVAVVIAAIGIAAGQQLFAQAPGWNFSTSGMNSFFSAANMSAAANYQQPPVAARSPIARLVANPDPSSGLPPYALTDQYGTIQRYVEPVPNIDLEPYVNQVVIVKHDTGQTLLASQLELPQLPLYPMVGETFTAPVNDFGDGDFQALQGEPTADSGIRQAQFVENADTDDSTVELLNEGQEIQSGPEFPGAYPGGAMNPDGSYPMYSEPMMSGGPPMMAGPMVGAPMQFQQPYMQPYPGAYGMAPCPQCGGFHPPQGGPCMSPMQPYGQPQRPRRRVYADVELNFFRPHIMEDQVGKLSEKYEFSPRFILGFTDVGPFDGRIRYWIYDRDTEILDENEDLHLKFSVLDLEATHTFCGRRSEVMLAAGVRFARVEFDIEDDEANTDLLGLTMAADGRTPLFSVDAGRIGWVYGGRLSILGGNWGADPGSPIDELRDDNVVVHELYAGLEGARRYRKLDLHARLVFEMQNWHSDVLNEGIDSSIGIIGPGLHVGAEF